MAEIEATLHQKYHKELHDMVKESFRKDRALEKQYDDFREKYWKERTWDLF